MVLTCTKIYSKFKNTQYLGVSIMKIRINGKDCTKMHDLPTTSDTYGQCDREWVLGAVCFNVASIWNKILNIRLGEDAKM